jgi:hypothetical protein
LNEEKAKHVNLAQQNGCGPAFFQSFLRVVKGTANLNTYYYFDGSRWVAIRTLPPICNLNFSFMGGVGKK